MGEGDTAAGAANRAGGDCLLVLVLAISTTLGTTPNRVSAMKVALIGFPLSGRTTLFEALTGGQAHEGVASVAILTRVLRH